MGSGEEASAATRAPALFPVQRIRVPGPTVAHLGDGSDAAPRSAPKASPILVWQRSQVPHFAVSVIAEIEALTCWSDATACLFDITFSLAVLDHMPRLPVTALSGFLGAGKTRC
jgi:hypothetical protein